MRLVALLPLLALLLSTTAHATEQPASSKDFHAVLVSPESNLTTAKDVHLPVAPPEPLPQPTLGEVAEQLSDALAGKQWSLALSLVVVALVLVLRKLASTAGGWGSGLLSQVLLWLSTPKGAVVLSVVGGTAALLSVALGGGKEFSLSLLISCFMGAASASGLFSWGQTLAKPTMAPPVCSPEEIANGTCKV